MDRLDQVFFGIGIEAFCQDLAKAIKFTVFYMQTVSDSTCIIDGFACIEVFMGWRIFLHSLCHGESWPRSLDVDFCILVLELSRTVGSHRTGFYDLFRLVDDVFDIPISLVCFDSGEFRIVAGIHALVSEVSRDLENSFITADEQSLQIKLRRDTQIHGHIESIEMGGEWLRIRTAIQRLEDRSLDFEEAVVRIPLSNGAHHSRTLDESIFDFRIDHEVKVSLAIALFLVGETMPFFRQRTQRLGQHREMQDANSELTGVGLENDTFDTKDITEIDEFEESPFIFRQLIFSEIELDIAALVTQDTECGLALPAADHDTASEADMSFILFELLSLLSDVRCMVIVVKLLTIWFYAERTDLLQLFTTDQHLVIQLRPVILIHFLCHFYPHFINSTKRVQSPVHRERALLKKPVLPPYLES